MAEEGTYCTWHLLSWFLTPACVATWHMWASIRTLSLGLPVLGEGLCAGQRQSVPLGCCVSCRELGLSRAFSLEGGLVLLSTFTCLINLPSSRVSNGCFHLQKEPWRPVGRSGPNLIPKPPSHHYPLHLCEPFVCGCKSHHCSALLTYTHTHFTHDALSWIPFLFLFVYPNLTQKI